MCYLYTLNDKLQKAAMLVYAHWTLIAHLQSPEFSERFSCKCSTRTWRGKQSSWQSCSATTQILIDFPWSLVRIGLLFASIFLPSHASIVFQICYLVRDLRRPICNKFSKKHEWNAAVSYLTWLIYYDYV